MTNLGKTHTSANVCGLKIKEEFKSLKKGHTHTNIKIVLNRFFCALGQM